VKTLKEILCESKEKDMDALMSKLYSWVEKDDSNESELWDYAADNYNIYYGESGIDTLDDLVDKIFKTPKDIKDFLRKYNF